MAKLVKQYFTANGSWTAPAGVTEVILVGCGGGGGGGAGYSSGGTNGGGGGGGAIQVIGYISVTPNTSYTVTIGSGGAGHAAPTAGDNGGTTSFGTIFYARGGGGGPEGLGAADKNTAGNIANSSISTSLNANNLYQAGSGGSTINPTANGPNGIANWSGNGSYSGGTGGTSVSGTSGGGGGGAGPQGNGANGANGVSSGTGTTGSSASANTGAGGGGGGGTAGAGAAGGAGGNGGSGYLYVIWVD